MLNNLISIAKYRIKPGTDISLKDFDTEYKEDIINKEEGEKLLEESKRKLSEMQDKLYAHDQYSVLIIFQAMDAAGKDGAVK